MEVKQCAHSIDEIHRILYSILCSVDEICTKENIAYALEGGTLIGAIRHKGFIPWDDDIDIAIWQKDFPRFKAAMEKNLPPYYQLTTPRDLAPYFYDFVVRVQDTRYYWHEPTQNDLQHNNLQNYMCVDVFLLNNSANTYWQAKLFAMEHLFLYGLAMGHRVSHSTQKMSVFQKKGVRILSSLGYFLPLKTILDWYDKVSMKYADKPGKYCICSTSTPRYLPLVYERKWHDEIIRVPFENRMFCVRKYYHEILTLQYGDYMKPPKDMSIHIQHSKFGQTGAVSGEPIEFEKGNT